MIAIVEGLGMIIVAFLMMYAIVKFVENCSGDDNAD
jgi:hypothetical protein